MTLACRAASLHTSLLDETAVPIPGIPGKIWHGWAGRANTIRRKAAELNEFILRSSFQEWPAEPEDENEVARDLQDPEESSPTEDVALSEAIVTEK